MSKSLVAKPLRPSMVALNTDGVCVERSYQIDESYSDSRAKSHAEHTMKTASNAPLSSSCGRNTGSQWLEILVSKAVTSARDESGLR